MCNAYAATNTCFRPFERTLTLHKDSTAHIGFQFKDGEIKAIVVGSSAARNGLLIAHNLVEVSQIGENKMSMYSNLIKITTSLTLTHSPLSNSI